MSSLTPSDIKQISDIIEKTTPNGKDLFGTLQMMILKYLYYHVLEKTYITRNMQNMENQK